MIITLIIMLIITNISELWWQLANKSYQSLLCEEPLNTSKINLEIIFMGISGMGVSVPYTLAHWLFAERYWILSFKLDYIVKRYEEEPPNIKVVQFLSWLVMFNIVGWQIVSLVVFYGMDLGQMEINFVTDFLLYFGIMSQVIFDIISIFVLKVAFNRIRAFSGSLLQVNERMMNFHLVSYIAAVVSLLIFIASNIRSNKR